MATRTEIEKRIKGLEADLVAANRELLALDSEFADEWVRGRRFLVPLTWSRANEVVHVGYPRHACMDSPFSPGRRGLSAGRCVQNINGGIELVLTGDNLQAIDSSCADAGVSRLAGMLDCYRAAFPDAILGFDVAGLRESIAREHPAVATALKVLFALAPYGEAR